MGSYVSCLYEKECYDGINEEVSVKENKCSIKPVSILISVGVNSWKLVTLGNFLQKIGDFYYRNTNFSTFSP